MRRCGLSLRLKRLLERWSITLREVQFILDHRLLHSRILYGRHGAWQNIRFIVATSRSRIIVVEELLCRILGLVHQMIGSGCSRGGGSMTIGIRIVGVGRIRIIGVALTWPFCRVRIHVVVDVFGHLVLGGKATSAIWHWAAEWTIAL